MKQVKNIRKILAVILSAIMLLSVVPMSVFAEESIYDAEVTAIIDGVPNTTQYYSLADAFYAAQYQTCTVKLLRNADNVEGKAFNYYGIRLSEGGNVTLDLNGYTIQKYNNTGGLTNNNNIAFFYVTGDTKLTVTDSVGGGKIQQTVNMPAFIVDQNASLTIEGGTVTNSNSAGIRVDSGTLTVSGGAIESYGAGIQVGGGTVTVTGNPRIHGKKSNALLINGTSTVTLSGGRYTTDETDGHSIWATVGKVENLLVDGFRYTDSNGNNIEVISNKYGSGTNCADISVSDFGIKYIDADGNEQKCTNFTELTESTDTRLPLSGWYSVSGTVNITAGYSLGVSTDKELNLILCEGATLNMERPLYLMGDATLNIYGQNGGTGTLNVKDSINAGNPAIGHVNNVNANNGTVNIYGGTVIAQSGGAGAQAIGFNPTLIPNGKVNVNIAPGLKCVKTDDLNTPYAYNNTDGTSITITKCTEHKWTYSNYDNDETHDQTCELCNMTETGVAHTVSGYDQNGTGETHYLVCACGQKYKQEEHTYTYTPNDDGLTHTTECVCGLKESVKHYYDSEDSESCYYCKAEIKATYNGAKYTSLQGAVNAAARDDGMINDTVTLYADLVAEDVVVDSGNITIDLNYKEWKTGLLDGSSYTPLTVNGGTVTLKSGNLFQGSSVPTGASGIVVNGGALVLESGISVKGGYINMNAAYPSITVNGGEIELLPGANLLTGLKVPEGKVLADYLFEDEDMGTAFVKCTYDGNGGTNIPWPYEYVTDVYTSNETSETMRVVEHNHDIDENGACECGWHCDAQITYSDGTTGFVEKLDGDGMLEKNTEVKLLRDVTITNQSRFERVAVLDLNGHTLTNKIVVRSDLTVKNSSANRGIIDGEVSTNLNAHSDGEPTTLTVEGNVKIKSLSIGRTCSAELKGGIFGKINCANLESYRVYPILAKGYAFVKYNAETGEITDEFETAAYSKAILENVAVVPHEHTYTAESKGVCACGYTCIHQAINENGVCIECRMQIYTVKLITSDGTENLYTFADGWKKAIENEGSTLKLICDVELDVDDSFSAESGKFTLDLDGKTFSNLTSKYLFLIGGTADITIKNGKLINTLAADSSSSNQSSGADIFLTGGKVTLDGVELTAGTGLEEERSYSVMVGAGELWVKDSTFTGAVVIVNTGECPIVKITSATFNDGIDYMLAGGGSDTDTVKSFFAEGSMLFDENGKYIDVASEIYWDTFEDQGMTLFEYGEKCTVKPHTHTMDGNNCSECGFYCEHKNYDANTGKCNDCGAQVYAAVWKNSKGFELFSETLEKAWTAACGDEGSTVILLCDLDVGTGEDGRNVFSVTEGKFTLDLNDHTLSSEALEYIISVEGTADITIINGKIVNTFYGEAGNGQFYDGYGNAVEITGGSATLKDVELTGGTGSYDNRDIEPTPIHIQGSGTLIASNCVLNGTFLVWATTPGATISVSLASTKLQGISFGGFVSEVNYNLINNFFAEGNVLLDKDGKYVDTTDENCWASQEIEGMLYAAYKYSGEATVTPHTHTYENGVCDSCGYKCKHTGGNATYFTKAVCDICGAEYGDYAPDTTAPTGKITINKTYGWKQILSDITFGLFFKDDVKVEITAEDDSYSQRGYDAAKHAVKIEYFISNEILEEDAVRAATFTEYDGEIGLLDDENYVVYAKLTDYAGNVTIIGSDGFAIDTIAPEIVGYKDGETVNACGNLTLTFNDANLKEVTYTPSWSLTPIKADLVDGKYITLSGSYGEQVVTATDMAGNSTGVTFYINWEHDFDSETKKCNHCGQNALVEQTIDGVTELYGSYDEAISALNRADWVSTELKLLGDINDNSLSIDWSGAKRVLNLNGHTFSIKPSDSEKNGELYLCNSVDAAIVGGGILDADCYVMRGGTLTVDNADGKITKLTQNSGTLKVLSGSIDELEITESKYDNVTKRTTELCGGSYGSIKVGFEGLTCADLLKKGYCYKGVKYENAKVKELNNAEVALCEHKDIQANGYCPDCGQTGKATVEFGGEIQFFKTLEDAVKFAEENDGSVIKLLLDITLDRHSSLLNSGSINLTKGTYTIDLNGKTLNLEKDSAASEPLSQLKIADDCHLTIADSVGGGKVTTGTIDADTAAQIYDDAHLTVTGGDFTGIENFKVGLRGNLTLSGGSFRKIYTFASSKAGLKSPMDFLAEGYLYKIDDRFATADDIQFMQDDPNTGARYENYIENVTVVPAPKLNFSQYSLSVANNLTLNFGFDADIVDSGYFTNIYAEFTIAGNTVKVDSDKMTANWDDPQKKLYEFSLVNIDPNQMTETVTAQLFGEHDGKPVSSDIKTVTIADYLYKLLDTEESAKLKTLVVDMLNYGTAAQVYTDRNLDNLANARLTDEQKALGTAEKPELEKITDTKYKTIENPTVNWKTAGVTLKNAITLRFGFEVEDDNIDDLYVGITTYDPVKIPADQFIKKADGSYYVELDDIYATELSDGVFVTVYNKKDNKPVSNTLRYSVESYAYTMQNSSDTKLADLVIALMKYGNSAKEYNKGVVG